MATCVVPFQTQLSSIMEALVKAAVAEISQLVEDKVSLLQLELSRRQSENDALRRRLRPEARGTPPPQRRGLGEAGARPRLLLLISQLCVLLLLLLLCVLMSCVVIVSWSRAAVVAR